MLLTVIGQLPAKSNILRRYTTPIGNQMRNRMRVMNLMLSCDMLLKRHKRSELSKKGALSFHQLDRMSLWPFSRFGMEWHMRYASQLETVRYSPSYATI